MDGDIDRAPEVVVAVENSRPGRKMHRSQEDVQEIYKEIEKQAAGRNRDGSESVGWLVCRDDRRETQAQDETGSESSASRENGCKTNERPTML